MAMVSRMASAMLPPHCPVMEMPDERLQGAVAVAQAGQDEHVGAGPDASGIGLAVKATTTTKRREGVLVYLQRGCFSILAAFAGPSSCRGRGHWGISSWALSISTLLGDDDPGLSFQGMEPSLHSATAGE